jgi:RNA polymerase sigma factor (sigma-70 family)
MNLFLESGSSLAYVSEALQSRLDRQQGWKIATNNALSLLQLMLFTDGEIKRNPPVAPDPEDPPEPVSPQRSVEDLLLSSERGRQISAAVEQLPDRQRTVFTLCHMAEQSTSEVSRALGLSEATVRVHLFRAVRKLRKLLGPQDAGALGGAARSDAPRNGVTDNER